VQVDLEPGVVDSIKNCPIGTLFKQDNFIHANNGAGKCLTILLIIHNEI
jgi:hypothetical protein